MNKLKFLLVSSLLFASACSETAPASNSTAARTEMGTISDMPRPAGGGGGGGRNDDPLSTAVMKNVSLQDGQPVEQKPAQRMIIRNADLNLEAPSPEEAQKQIGVIVESKGGFVVESTQSSANAQASIRDRVSMTIRVPAEKFNETLEEIRKVASRVILENVKGQDVTEEFVDVEARLKTKRELEARFLEILKQARSVADTLNVQTELSNVRGEIEQIEGKKRFLENQASLSTIKVNLQTPTVFSANSSGFFYQVSQSLNTGFEAALNFVLVFITFIIAVIPFLILVVLPIYLVLRYFWRKWKKRLTAKQIAREETE